MNQAHKNRFAYIQAKCLVCILYLFILFPLINKAQLPPDFQEETLVSGLNQPIAIAFLPDGRLMLGQRNGTILVSLNSQPQPPPVSFQTCLVIPNVNMGGERGLTQIILDPGFSSNGYFYVYYTQDLVDQGRVSRFTYNPATRTASAASEVIVWEDSTGFPGCCHYGGTLGFLEDGSLLIAIGDKFEAANAQDLTDPAGKLHRVNPALGWYNGTIPGNNIPTDNPLYDGSSGLLNASGQIQSLFAIGLRNPFTGYNDRRGGNWKLYIAEVGGNDHSKAFEDIHLAQLSDIAPGQLLNYGWPACGDGAGGQSGGTDNTGRNPVTGECINDNGLYSDPIFAYPHSGGQSIIMGFANEGGQLPSEYNNALFYGDYTKGVIKYVLLDANGTVMDYPAGTPPGNPLSFYTNTDEIVAMAQGPDGSLYWVSLQRNTNLGYVNRINFTGGLAPVIHDYSASPLSAPAAPTEVAFDFTVSDADNSPEELSYTLIFGDGNQVTGTMDAISLPITHTYGNNGNYTAMLQISDGIFSPSEEIILNIGTPPGATITAPLQGELFVAGQLIDYAGDNSGGVQEEWFIELYNQGTLQPRFTGNGSGGSFTTAASAMNHVDFSFEKWYRITYRVTDANGLTAEDFVEIFPDEVNTTLTSTLQGVVLNIDGEPRATPYTFDDVKGFGHEISAPGEVCINSIRYIFDGWSDGGGQTHAITIPDTDQSFTANYIASGPCGGLPVSGGLVMRLKGDSGLSSSNGAVTGWSDMSALSNDLLVVSGSPTLVPGGLNGHDLVQFDGIDDALGKPGFTGLPLAANERSVFMMVQYETGKYGGFTYGNAAVNQVFGLMAKGNGCNAPKGTLALEGWGCSNMLTSGEQALGSGWLSHAAVYDGTAVVHYKDGQAIGSNEHAYDTASGIIRMGAQHNDSKFTKMQVAEILVYDRALTETERQQIEDYFQQEYFGQTTQQPDATITAPLQGELFVAGQLIDYAGDNSGGVQEEWFIELYNQGTLQPRFTGNGSGGSFTTAASAMNHVDFSFEKWYRITYRVTDANGLTAEDFVEIFPDEVNTTLTSTLQGVVLNIDGEPRATPYTFDDVKGFGHEISAPGEVCINSIRYIFDGWSDGGGQTHAITIPDTDQSFTANYIASGPCGGLPVSGGLVMRLKGDSGLSSSNGAVTGWSDMSALSNDLLVVSGSPTLVPGGLNGHDLVQFDGIDDALGKPGFTGLPLAANERSVFMMVQYETGKYGGFTYGNAAVNQVFGLMAKGNGCNAPKGTLALEGWGCSNMLTSGEQALGSGWLSHAAVYDGTAVVHYKDGQAIGSNEHAYDTASGIIRMGAQHNDSKFTKMQVAEILVYDRALTETERQQIEDYFQQEYFQQGASALKQETSFRKQATLSLNISLQGRSDYSGTYTIELYHLNSLAIAYSISTAAATTGALFINGIVPGDYQVSVKHPQYLQRTENLTLQSGTNSLVFAPLLAGDANGDNQVTLLDYSVLKGTFNLAEGSPEYDARGDLNGDGQVTILDFSLLASNFMKAGEEVSVD